LFLFNSLQLCRYAAQRGLNDFENEVDKKS
jgi:hypothetical protein